MLKVNPAITALSSALLGFLFWATHHISPTLTIWDRSTRTRSVDYNDIRVGVYEGSGFHDDVAGALIYAAELSGAQVTSYRSSWRFGYSDILTSFHTKPTVSEATQDRDSGLEQALRTGKLDVIVLASCDQRWLSNSLRSALVDSEAVQVLCMHHEGNLFHQHRSAFTQIAAQGRLQYISLGAHTSNAYARDLADWAIQESNPGWARYPVQTFVAHFPVPSFDATRVKRIGRMDRVAIMGDLDLGRRHFDRIFEQLEKAMRLDPASWGYHLTGSSTLEATDPAEAFQLHILGSNKGAVPIPALLNSSVVHIHPGTSYEEYYEVLEDMDLVVPAWRNNEYVSQRASASIAVAINTKIPTLLHRLVIESYPYLDPLAYLLHEAGESEIDQILRLRKGLTSNFAAMQTGRAARPFWQAEACTHESWERYHHKLQDWNLQILADVYNRVITSRQSAAALL